MFETKQKCKAGSYSEHVPVGRCRNCAKGPTPSSSPPHHHHHHSPRSTCSTSFLRRHRRAAGACVMCRLAVRPGGSCTLWHRAPLVAAQRIPMNEFSVGLLTDFDLASALVVVDDGLVADVTDCSSRAGLEASKHHCPSVSRGSTKPPASLPDSGAPQPSALLYAGRARPLRLSSHQASGDLHSQLSSRTSPCARSSKCLHSAHSRRWGRRFCGTAHRGREPC